MFTTRASEPGKQSVPNPCLVGQGWNGRGARVALPLGGRDRAPSWNPAAPGARPVVSPWQLTDLGAPTLERPRLPASWAHVPHEPVCLHRGEPRGREERGRDRMSQRNTRPGLRGDRSRPRRRGSTGNDWGLGEGREGAPWHPQRDLGPASLGSSTCGLSALSCSISKAVRS